MKAVRTSSATFDPLSPGLRTCKQTLANFVALKGLLRLEEVNKGLGLPEDDSA